MNHDLKFRLVTLLIALLIGVEIGMIGDTLMRKIAENCLLPASVVVAVVVICLLVQLLRWMEEP